MADILLYVGATYAAIAVATLLVFIVAVRDQGLKTVIGNLAKPPFLFGALWPYVIWLVIQDDRRVRQQARRDREQAERREDDAKALEETRRRWREEGRLTEDDRFVNVWMFFGDGASDIFDSVSVVREWNTGQSRRQTAKGPQRYRVLRVEREVTTRPDGHTEYTLAPGDRLVAVYAPPSRSAVYHGSLETDRDRHYEDWEVLSNLRDSRPSEIPPDILREIDAEAGPSWRRHAKKSWIDAVKRHC